MSEKVTKLIDDVKTLTVIELSEFVKAVEKEFGVSAAAPVTVAAAPAAGAAPAAEEKTEFNVVLKAAVLHPTICAIIESEKRKGDYRIGERMFIR
jgi:large subunit ribosomal protein L7/L12